MLTCLCDPKRRVQWYEHGNANTTQVLPRLVLPGGLERDPEDPIVHLAANLHQCDCIYPPVHSLAHFHLPKMGHASTVAHV